ncbi:MAG: phospholipase [Myxococcaceae bacterium]|nr:phospholipase [Myxococcaceae bacterium]
MALNGTNTARLKSQLEHQGRLESRPRLPTAEAPSRGMLPLGLGGQRDGLVYVPAGYGADRPAPLVVMLHGAGGHARHALGILQEIADAQGFILLAPESRGSTWDVIIENYGPDVAFIDQALAHVFERYAVDPARVAIGGFSDGASYALSLGIANGDLFTHVLAFSPGFASPPAQHGAPRIYVSHGMRDAVLPIDRCSRSLVPRLQGAGYDVRYHEFDGPHTVPGEIAREAVEWFTAAAPR